jgi:hypothetical protein
VVTSVQCAVCMESFGGMEDMRVYKLPCGHSFCAECIEAVSLFLSLSLSLSLSLTRARSQWVAEPTRLGRPTCPACRQPFVSLRHCASADADCVALIAHGVQACSPANGTATARQETAESYSDRQASAPKKTVKKMAAARKPDAPTAQRKKRATSALPRDEPPARRPKLRGRADDDFNDAAAPVCVLSLRPNAYKFAAHTYCRREPGSYRSHGLAYQRSLLMDETQQLYRGVDGLSLSL